MSAWLGLLGVLLLVLANGFFVATEFAIVAVRRSRLEQLAREGHPRASVAQEIIRDLDAYIAACQFGITLASLALGWIGEPALAGLIEAPLALVAGRLAPVAAHAVAIGAGFALITALHIVIGELAPKGLALQRPEATTLAIARPMQMFYLVFRWPINALNAVGNAALRLLGLEPASGHDMVHSAQELALLVEASERAGTVEESEARIASRAFHLADLTAHDLMTPRTELDAVPASIAPDELFGRAEATTHAALPVYEGSLDEILGVIRVRDLLPIARRPGAPVDMRALLVPVPMVPASRQADDLLEDMRHGVHIAVVVDEHGGTAGIVTLGDLMRALVGRIGDEPLGPGAASVPRPEPDGSVVLDGLTRLHELEEMIGVEIEDAQRASLGTLGGLIMARLDRLPHVSDEIRVADRRLRVEQLDGRRVARVRLFPPAPAGGPRRE